MHTYTTVVEEFARELHRSYRAGCKALSTRGAWNQHGFCHDHGWRACSRQTFFRGRARRLLKLIGLMGLALRPDRQVPVRKG